MVPEYSPKAILLLKHQTNEPNIRMANGKRADKAVVREYPLLAAFLSPEPGATSLRRYNIPHGFSTLDLPDWKMSRPCIIICAMIAMASNPMGEICILELFCAIFRKF